jgi:hypothetical protein
MSGGAASPQPNAAVTDGERREGYIDVIAATGVFGWAWNPDAPAQKVELEVREGDRVLGRIRADEARQDLQAAGIGDGRCGFAFYYDAETAPADPQAVTVVFADTGAALNRPNPDEMITAVAQRVENSARFAVRAAQALARRAERLEKRDAETAERLAAAEQAVAELEGFVNRIDRSLRTTDESLRKQVAARRGAGRLRRVAVEVGRIAAAAGVAVAVMQVL